MVPAVLRGFHPAQFPARLPINTAPLPGSGIVDLFDEFFFARFVRRTFDWTERQRDGVALSQPRDPA